MPRTAFDPAHHGFGSAIRSQSQRFIGPIHLSVGGRCGGVVQAAQDHLLSALPIPPDTALPAGASALGTCISQRQDKSITNSLDLCRRADAEQASFHGAKVRNSSSNNATHCRSAAPEPPLPASARRARGRSHPIDQRRGALMNTLQPIQPSTRHQAPARRGRGWGGWACFGFALLPQLACAAALNIELGSTTQFSSALYSTPPSRDDRLIQSLPAWDALQREAQTRVELAPRQSDGFHFDQDHSTAWTIYRQPVGADATLRAFAQLSGYYLNDGGVDFASNEIHIHNVVAIENNGATGVYFNLVLTSHGLLLAGGVSNNLTARAQEDAHYVGLCGPIGPNVILSPLCIDGSGNAAYPFQGSWSGGATVTATGAAPTVTVSGDWQGRTVPVSTAISGFADPFQGIELQSLLGSRTVGLNAGEQIVVDVDFRGTYQVTSGAGSGYLSFAGADFSGTGLLDYRAIDPGTGLPAAGVTVRLLPVAVPWPPTAWLMALGLVATAFEARRRRGGPARPA